MITKSQKVLLALGVLAGFIAYQKAKKAAEALNPASRENVVYQTVAGEDGTVRTLDSFFARATLLNPLASDESKQQARNFLEVNQQAP